MKIEVDRFYRTRDGRKAYVALTHDFDAPSKHLGMICGYGDVLDWNSDGECVAPSWDRGHCDLVSEWEDSVEVDHFYRTRDGQKVYVYKYNADEKEFAGAILGSVSLFWHYDGSAVEGSENELDLVAPWEDEDD